MTCKTFEATIRQDRHTSFKA